MHRMTIGKALIFDLAQNRHAMPDLRLLRK